MSLGINIKKMRLEKNLKQSELAEMAKISRVAIGNYERGTREPTATILNKIATALGVTINDLVEKISFEGETLEEITSQLNSNELISEERKKHLIDILEPKIKLHETPPDVSDEQALIYVKGLLNYIKYNTDLNTNEMIALKNATVITIKLKLEEMDNDLNRL
ncbi:helix-turn-helix domain-containing protein [Clostridium algoriphilum]|uniref:helix-turn-helix domain-containing protein n=1 Tax=Clostridium algoriphilum TaxID=198347 RepID=UPI001CF5C67F|nr:helix-turn-helix transcriptional regulator [Clostridium algoriphilum]MCB2294681.1 helix-turn-helix domain-containing protein [Clostridium algoriphilum]